MEELKPCPFCSGTPELGLPHGESYPAVHCLGCGASVDVRYGIEEVSAAWDIRPAEDALRSKIAATEKKLSSALALYEEYHDVNVELREKISALEDLLTAASARAEAAERERDWLAEYIAREWKDHIERLGGYDVADEIGNKECCLQYARAALEKEYP